MNRALDVLAVGDGNLDVWMRVPRHSDRRRGGVRGSGVVGDASHVRTGFTVGAGDAFASGLLYSFLLKEHLEDMAAFANAAAAIKIGTPGASEGMPGADEVRAFHRENA